MATQVDTDSVRRKLKFDYLKAKNDASSRTLDVFSQLLGYFQKPQIVVHDMIQDAANLIQRQFRLRWAMVGLKSQSDGLYRYEVHCGMRPDSWARQKARAYKLSDFALHTNSYNAGEISRLTRVYLEEENPLGKDDTGVLNRPILLGTRRKSDDETLEADFIDTLIVGPGDDLLGWIEYSGTVTMKFPDPMTIRNIEVISGILSAAITMQNQRRP
jgi:hypothetical protein